MRRGATVVALLATVATAAVGLRYGTRAAGGSDSSCYALMAQAIAAGAAQPRSDLALTAPWPDPALTSAPAGFIPSPVVTDAASPICAPGFALLAAPLVWAAGPDGLFWITPLAGALLVWTAFLIARRLAGDAAGVATAMTVATMPVFLYQVVQPMNDVATAACWAGGVAALIVGSRPRAWMAGGMIGLALLMRPNLLPAGLVLGLVVLWQHGPANAARFSAAVVPSGLAVMVLNTVLYGLPLQSGYGDASALFRLDNVPLNLSRHGRAIVETQCGWPLLGLLASLVVTGARPAVWLALVSALAVVACYLPYVSFPEWWYLRFLLPALVLLVALATATASAIIARWSDRWAPGVVLAAAIGLSLAQVQTARQRLAFDLRAIEARFRVTGEVVRDRLPAMTTAITGWDSGSIRYHAGRDIVMWDGLDPAWLDRAVWWLEEHGRFPVVVVERWEEAPFRERFAGQAFGALDWPPRFDVEGRVRMFVPADRERHLAGDPVATAIVREHRR